MNLNGQIDWSDTDRIVSNDTRYISLNGSWWRESSTWQTRQNGSPALTRVGLTRTRLTGLASWNKSGPKGSATGIFAQNFLPLFKCVVFTSNARQRMEKIAR
jgi:hypothetical protein